MSGKPCAAVNLLRPRTLPAKPTTKPSRILCSKEHRFALVHFDHGASSTSAGRRTDPCTHSLEAWGHHLPRGVTIPALLQRIRTPAATIEAIRALAKVVTEEDPTNSHPGRNSIGHGGLHVP